MKTKTILSAVLLTICLTGCLISKDSMRLFSTIKIDNYTYFDETEVDVGSWLSYYTWKLEHEGLDAAQKVLPDSGVVEPEVWQYINHKSNKPLNYVGRYSGVNVGFFCNKCSDFIQYDKWINSIPEHCPFIDFPVTGLTYEQVVDFCNWRTKVQGDNKVIYRLPTNQEWTDFALRGLTENEKRKRFRDSTNNNCPTYNYKTTCKCFKEKSAGNKQNGIGRYPPDSDGAFDLFGNVSEMTATKGESRGGNYLGFANKCHLDSIQFYNKPEIWLGFRCLVIKLEGKK